MWGNANRTHWQKDGSCFPWRRPLHFARSNQASKFSQLIPLSTLQKLTPYRYVRPTDALLSCCFFLFFFQPKGPQTWLVGCESSLRSCRSWGEPWGLTCRDGAKISALLSPMTVAFGSLVLVLKVPKARQFGHLGGLWLLVWRCASCSFESWKLWEFLFLSNIQVPSLQNSSPKKLIEYIPANWSPRFLVASLSRIYLEPIQALFLTSTRQNNASLATKHRSTNLQTVSIHNSTPPSRTTSHSFLSKALAMCFPNFRTILWDFAWTREFKNCISWPPHPRAVSLFCG